MANMPVYSAPTSKPKRRASPSTSRDGPDPKVPKRNDNDDAPRPGSNAVRIIESHNPIKSQNDPNEYKMIKLSNGLRTLLISRKVQNNGAQPRPNGNLKPRFPFFQRLPDNPIIDDLRDYSPSLYFYSQVPNFACQDNEWDNPELDLFGGSGLFGPSRTSVALVVNIGGLQDPKTAEGLAHFTEHVVHYGSVKFPREEEVSEWVWNFGFGNAETRQFTTSYYNEVPDTILDKNLERFSEMLTNPSMKVEFLKREANAVDNEFYLRQPHFRKQLLQAHVGYPDGKNHPLGRFWIGTLQTLGGNKTPVVQEEMRKNIKNNYVASAMTLVINSTKSMNELEQLAIKYFSKLNEGMREVRHETEQKDAKDHRLRVDLEGKYFFLQGISNRSELTLIWHLPAEVWMKDKNDKTMPVIHLLLTNSSEKGLFAHLKEEGLIWMAQVYHNQTPYAVILEIDYQLTDKGRIPENTVRIQEATFQYTKHLQQMNEMEIRDYFDQIRILQLKEFHYGSQRPTMETTAECAYRMQTLERPLEVINFDSWEKASLNYARIRGALKRLNPTPSADEKIPGVTVIETLAKNESLEGKMAEFQRKVKGLKIEEEPHTKAKYFSVPRSAIMKDDAKMKTNYAGVFSFPKISPYLKTEVAHLRNEIQKRGGGDMDEANPPLRYLIAPVNHGNIHPLTPLNYKSRVDPPGNTSTPKIAGVHLGHSESGLDPYRSIVLINFYTSEQRASTSRGFALNWLWAFCIRQSLAKYKTEFALAGYDFSILHQAGVFSITIKGFPTHLQDISEKIVTKVFGEPVTEHTFNLAKEELKHVMEMYLGESGHLTGQFINNILFYGKDLTMDCLGVVKELTFADLQSIVNAHRVSTSVVIILIGNVPPTYFQNLAVTLDAMDFGPFRDQVSEPLKFAIPRPDLHNPGETCLRVRNLANCSYNNTVTNLYILGKSPESGDLQAQCFVAGSKFLNQQAFMHLRTQEQLAYVVSAGSLMLRGMRFPVSVIYVAVVATAEKHAPCELDQKIDEFIAKYGGYLEALPDALYDLMAQMNGLTVKKDEVAEYFNSKFGEDFGIPDREWKCRRKGIRKLSIQELAAGNPLVKHKPCNCAVCAGISQWKKSQTLHESSLEFAIGDKETKDYFITLPKD